ncbi:trans-Golgi network integral membrane protein 2 [Vipera latastei]
MAACWCWALLLCQLAAWGSAAPLEAEKSHGKALGANAPEFSSRHQQLTDSAQDASDTAIGSADHNSPHVIQNKQPKAPQQDSVKPKGTENSSINSQSGLAGSSNTEKDTEKVREGQTGVSDTLSPSKSKTTELKQGEDSSIKTLNVKPGGPAQDSSDKNPVHLEESETDASHSDLNVMKLEHSEDVERKDQHHHPGLSVQNPTSAKVDSSEVTNAHKDTSLPKPKTTELKQGEDQSIKTLNVKPGGPAQDSSEKNPDQTKNVQEKPDLSEESETDASHSVSNVKKLEQSEDLELKDQHRHPGLSVQKPTSAKVDSSEVTNAHKDTSLPKPKTTELKQGEDQSIKTLNVKPGGPAQDKNKKTDTEISDTDFSELETDDEESQQMEDTLAKDQDLQSDLSAKNPQKSNPLESKKSEEEVVDPRDEQEKGLGDEKKKSAKHEEDSEGTPKNGSENSHFFAYLVTTAIVVAALYIAYHNKRKIIAFALEGKKSKTARRPKSSDYQRLDQKI